MPSIPVPSSASKSEYDWQADDDMRTLARAAEIRADPKRMKRAQVMAAKRLKELQAIAGPAAGKGK